MLEALSEKGTAILNGDDPHVRWMESRTKAKVLYYGFEKANAIQGSDYILRNLEGSSFQLHIKGEVFDVKIKLYGKHMVYSVLAAITLGVERGFPVKEIISRVENLDPTSGRLEPIQLENGAVLLDDTTKGSQESFYAAIETFEQMEAKRKIFVFGDVHEPVGKQGDICREIGERLAKFSDKGILVGSLGLKILKGAAARAGMDREKIAYVGSRIQPAIDILKEELREGDLVLIKGSGSQWFRRISLSLMGKEVKCGVKYCRVRTLSCDVCPLLNQEKEVFDNTFLKLLTTV